MLEENTLLSPFLASQHWYIKTPDTLRRSSCYQSPLYQEDPNCGISETLNFISFHSASGKSGN